jgi:Ca2+-binding EF-hand superfamily protein
VKAVGGALVGTPLSIAWAPETFVQGDTNEDENLDVGEFSEQLKRIGVTSEDAQKLFSSFDTSSDGKLSIFEFVDGVTQSIKNGEKQFTDLVNSYTQDKSGHFDQVATKDFLDKGAALAAKYEKAAGIGR